MKIFKFGGASIKNQQALTNLISILQDYKNEKLIIIVSAMGKTTNSLEKVVDLRFSDDKLLLNNKLEEIKQYHLEICGVVEKNNELLAKIEGLFYALELYLNNQEIKDYDFEYDQIVCFGEILSSTILSYFLKEKDLNNEFVDARHLIFTDDNYREGIVNWQKTQKKIVNFVKDTFEREKDVDIILSQGFIGSAPDQTSTTLGREGSDFTAAIFAYCLNAESVTIWKDVDGIMSADPKWMPQAEKIEKLSYSEIIELAYYGASVIHPKTIKPLQNANISLYVKSFINYKDTGTVISDFKDVEYRPLYIKKTNQILISFRTKDFSFIAEKNLSSIYSIIHDCKLKANLTQNSAISLSVCMDNKKRKIEKLIKELSSKYYIRSNENLELISIRHPNQKCIDEIIDHKKIIVENRTRRTVQFVVE